MSFGIFVMLIIIIVELIAVVYMFRVGLQHDAHNDIARVESSKALKRLSARGIDVITAPASAPIAEVKKNDPEPAINNEKVASETDNEGSDVSE